MDIRYFNAATKQMETEKVYGEGAVKWLYDSLTGKAANKLITTKLISKLYGAYQDFGHSNKKVLPFIKNFNINMDEFLIEVGRNESSPYATFNNFFVRRFKPGMRSFPEEDSSMGAPCEARYFGWNELNDDVSIPVKGAYLRAKDLLSNEKWGDVFDGGPGYIARLCPVDYHRFHYPAEGEVIEHYPVNGVLDSVNPIALKKKGRIFIDNERYVSILETKEFGKIAYIEVGATCVGKIVQSHSLKSFSKGEEKGYFLFGGSTVIVLGEPGKWTLSEDLVDYTDKETEVYYKLGMPMARKL